MFKIVIIGCVFFFFLHASLVEKKNEFLADAYSLASKQKK